jgi:uncharacterized protein (DUF3084 family)
MTAHIDLDDLEAECKRRLEHGAKFRSFLPFMPIEVKVLSDLLIELRASRAEIADAREVSRELCRWETYAIMHLGADPDLHGQSMRDAIAKGTFNDLSKAREALARVEAQAESDTEAFEVLRHMYRQAERDLGKVTAERDAMGAVMEAARKACFKANGAPYEDPPLCLSEMQDAIRALDALTAAAAKPPEP